MTSSRDLRHHFLCPILGICRRATNDQLKDSGAKLQVPHDDDVRVLSRGMLGVGALEFDCC